MDIMCFRGGGGRGDEENRLIFICTSKNGSKNILVVKMRNKDKKKLASGSEDKRSPTKTCRKQCSRHSQLLKLTKEQPHFQDFMQLCKTGFKAI